MQCYCCYLFPDLRIVIEYKIIIKKKNWIHVKLEFCWIFKKFVFIPFTATGKNISQQSDRKQYTVSYKMLGGFPKNNAWREGNSQLFISPGEKGQDLGLYFAKDVSNLEMNHVKRVCSYSKKGFWQGKQQGR